MPRTFEWKIVHRSTKSGLWAWINIHFGQGRQQLVSMLRWVTVLSLQQRNKELRNDASSQLEAIDAVWCKLIEYWSQLLNKRFTSAGLRRPFLNPSFDVCNQSTRMMTRTIVHSLYMYVHVRFLFFPKKSKHAQMTRNKDKKNDSLQRVIFSGWFLAPPAGDF